MDLSIRYLTKYTYGVEVGESQNALRACPTTNDHQQLISYGLTVDPPSNVVTYGDYWGTRVDVFGINQRHTRLTLVADIRVRTTAPRQPTGQEQLIDAVDEGWKDYEYRIGSPHVQWGPELAEWATALVSNSETPVQQAIAIHEGVGRHLAYVPESTKVGTPVAEIFENGQGVCQDYTHLSLAAFRAVGLSARYVSGYFYATPTGDQPTTDEVEVETHAWVEVAIPGFGWWGLDPTNQVVAGERHVKIGHGRDYEDVTPLRGIYHGETDSTELEVGVVMSRSDLVRHVIESQPPPRAQQLQQQQQQQ